jgi:membrane-bound inhibitor of C-type lysozyme
MHIPSLFLVVLPLILSACATNAPKEMEPSKDTFECMLQGDRYLVRFTEGESRILMPDGTRVVLYQIAAGSGVRYTNGMIELRGKGTELQIVRDGFARSLEGCKPVMVPKQEPSWVDRMMPAPSSKAL